MSLEHAILGFLHYKPLSGYDLKSVFDLSVQHFWPADQSQIYRTLSRLVENGMAEVEVIEQDDRPDRKVYHITDEGRNELVNWLTTPLPVKTDRIAKLIQIFFAGQLSDEEILDMFRRFADHARKVHEELISIKENPGQPDGSPCRDRFFWGLTLDYGIHITKANLAWFEDVISRIEQGQHLKGKCNENSRS